MKMVHDTDQFNFSHQTQAHYCWRAKVIKNNEIKLFEHFISYPIHS